jgi:transcriptional regulator with XRE-family HTH domain/tetratricopeptide (TPR) repeat protein
VARGQAFGTLLRQCRLAAGLTQERLAERSGISANGVAALEAGRRTAPRLNTVGLLCDALDLDAAARTAMFAAARTPDAAPPERSNAADVDDTTVLGSASIAEHTSGAPASFVGRIDELHLLRDAWQRRTRVGLLVGEAGVGKSSLAEAFAGELAAQGVAVLRGRATPHRLGAYEAFVEPARAALGRFDGGTVPTVLRDLGRLIPGLVEIDGDAMVPSLADPAVERRLLFEAVSTLLALGGPTLLLLDDLHWADAGALALLAFLAGRADPPDLLIIGTVRSTDVTASTSAALADLRRQCSVVRVDLAGLTGSELARLVVDVAGSPVSDALLRTVTDATNGNPLYVKELTEHLMRRGVDTDVADGWGGSSVPHGIRETIELRVASLSAEGQSLVRSGALLGQRFDLEVAGQLAELGGGAFVGAVEDALVSGLVVEESASTAAFSHGLVAATIYEGMSLTRRRLLHRSAAMALADRGPSSSAEIVDIARHWAFVAKADPGARATAADWSVRAGDAAAASAAIDEAIACYARAADLYDGPTSEHADALVRLGSALAAAGNVVEGNEHLQRGLHVADEAGDAAVYAKAALGLSASVRYTQSDHERIRELESAIAKFDPTEMVLRPALLATLRRQLGFVDTPEADHRRREAAASVLAAVSAPTVSDELVISLGGLRDSLVVDDPVPLGELARRIIRVASRRQDLPVLSTGWYRQAWAALELGDSVTFRQAVAEYRRIAEQLARPYEMAMSSNMIAAVAQIEGRYDDAEAAGQEALAHAATIEDGNFSWVYFANSGLRAIDQGGTAATYEVMQAVRDDFGRLPTFEAALAGVAALAGDHAAASRLTDEQLGVDGEILDRDWWYLSAERLPVLGLLAWGCAASHNTTQAELLRDRLALHAELGVRAVRVAPVGAWLGPIDHHLGALERVLGNLDRADNHLRRALLVEDEMNGRPFRVRTLLELADLASARGGAGAASEASAWRSQAEHLATELGLEAIVAGATLPT